MSPANGRLPNLTNGNAKLFVETIPVIQEQIKVINHRLKDIEKNKEE